MTDELRSLKKKLDTYLGGGYISYDTYTVGMHILQRMAAIKAMTVTVAWQEMASSFVTLRGAPLAPPAPGTAYRFYQALQELHRTVGLLSHVTISGLEEAKEEVRLSPLRESAHVTSVADTPSDVIGARTPIVFEFVPYAGPDCAASVSGYMEQGTSIELQKWLL